MPGLVQAKFWTSDEVLDIGFVQKSVIVLGGGIVACELAQFLNRIGARVTLIQRSRSILRDHSEDAPSKVVQKSFVDEGIGSSCSPAKKSSRSPRTNGAPP